jgi:hypothetical protein
MRLVIFFGCVIAIGEMVLPTQAQTTAPNEWTWIGGSNTVTNLIGQPGVYGTLGTPAASNIPGGRDSAATWTDSSGHFWLFGGEGADAKGNFGGLNDLWEFDPVANEWTWIGGSSTLPASCAESNAPPCGQPGVYGTLGSAAATNTPGGRDSAAAWTDSNGNFWLFGGYGFDANQTKGDLNDLWEFNPSTREWTWMGGSSSVGQRGLYGSFGSAGPANIPGGRDSAATWTDTGGDFWLFGGESFDANGNFGLMDDIWEFDRSTDEWTWMGGSNTLPSLCATSGGNGNCGWPTVYGALGVAAPAIGPGSRLAPATWRDNDGNFWLFGGLDSVFWEADDFSLVDQYDLWEFNPSTREWGWMGGYPTSTCSESTGETSCAQKGIYGTQGTPAIANIPPSRSGATPWADTYGNFWLLGGGQLATDGSGGICSDFWVFEPLANEWAWMGGDGDNFPYSCDDIEPGTYGTRGTPDAENIPSGRFGGASWTDSSGNLWLFGGRGFANGEGFNAVDLNDVWVYQPVAPAPEPSFELVASPNPINIGAFGPGTSGTTNGSTTVDVLVADGFDGAVTLTATPGTCNGVTCVTGSFNPGTVIGAGSSTLTISVVKGAFPAPEIYPFTITATSGAISQSIQVVADVSVVGQISPPSFSPPAGTYSTPQTVTITGSNYIYYTVDGSTPTPSSAVYVNPISVISTTTLQAFSFDVANEQSSLTTGTYTIVPASASFSITGTPISVAPGATTGNTSVITLTPSGGFSGVINLSCAITPTAASEPATCSIPASVTIGGPAAQTTTLTVNTTSGTSALNRTGGFIRPWVGETAFVCMLLVGIPARRRRRWRILLKVVLLFSVVGGALSCGGGNGGSGGGGGGGNPGTTPGTYVITVTGTSGSITQKGTLNLLVQ